MRPRSVWCCWNGSGPKERADSTQRTAREHRAAQKTAPNGLLCACKWKEQRPPLSLARGQIAGKASADRCCFMQNRTANLGGRGQREVGSLSEEGACSWWWRCSGATPGPTQSVPWWVESLSSTLLVPEILLGHRPTAPLISGVLLGWHTQPTALLISGVLLNQHTQRAKSSITS